MFLTLLTIFTFFLLTFPTVEAQDSAAQDALRGNNPRATLTTGIGQVVTPVGIPVVTPIGQKPPAPVAPTPVVTPTGEGEDEADEFGTKETKIKGRYELGEVKQKKRGGDKSAKTKPLPSMESGGGAALKAPQGPLKAKAVRIPTGRTPPVKTIRSD